MLFAGSEIFGLPYNEEDKIYTINEVTGDVVTSNKMIMYTMLFHTFVFMQVFNEINSRKLGD